MANESVKRGGRETPEGYRFEISGGDLALDLANTVDRRPTADPRELLRSYAELVSWGMQAGAVTEAGGRPLVRAAARRPAAAERVLRRARRLREAIFGLFAAIARGAAAPPADLAVLNDELPRALSRLRLAPARAGHAWAWDEEDGALDRVLWPVAWAAAELLAAGDRTRIRECAADECAWLFLDTSRNRSRRWCDMSVCGNRDKARRFYRRQRSGP